MSCNLYLKFYQKKIILHLIDHATRLSAAQFIPNKLAPTIVKAIMKFWIAVFGATDQFLTDTYIGAVDLWPSFQIIDRNTEHFVILILKKY